MEFGLTEDQSAIVEALSKLVGSFSDEYWLTKDREGGFPEDFYQCVKEGGWLGIALPEQYGGSGMGVTEAVLMMHTIAKSSGGMAAASAIHMNIFGPKSIAAFGSDDQKQRWLPGLINGDFKMCFGVTEPNVGLDTTRLKVKAERKGAKYIVSGQKIWTSTAQVAEKIMLLARTSPRNDANPTEGLSLFLTDLDRSRTTIKEIDKMGRKSVDSNEVFFDQMEVPVEDRIGEEGKGFRYILHSLNPERLLIGAEAIGLGQEALNRATRYAKDRVVFERPIGQNQAIQHPLAVNWAELEAAFLMVLKGAWLFDNGKSCGVEANAAKYLAAEAGFNACKQAVATHGGMGYAKEFHVERLLREVIIPYLAPVSQQMALNFIAEKQLQLPRSY